MPDLLVGRRGWWHQQPGTQRLRAGLHLAWPRRGAWRAGRAQARDAGGAQGDEGRQDPEGRQGSASSSHAYPVLQQHAIMRLSAAWGMEQVARQGEWGLPATSAAYAYGACAPGTLGRARWRQRGRATCVHGQCEGCLTWHDLGDQQQQGARTLSGGDFAGTGGLYDVWKEVVRG